MRCPECREQTKVVDSRTKVYEHKQAVYRRRVCLTCEYKFSTVEYMTDFIMLGHYKNKQQLRKEVKSFIDILTILKQHCVNETIETLIVVAKQLAGELNDKRTDTTISTASESSST